MISWPTAGTEALAVAVFGCGPTMGRIAFALPEPCATPALAWTFEALLTVASKAWPVPAMTPRFGATSSLGEDEAPVAFATPAFALMPETPTASSADAVADATPVLAETDGLDPALAPIAL